MSSATFFIIVPPGFEKLALSELQYKQAIPSDLDQGNIRILKGGIELDLEFEKGLALNQASHLATRVLVRIDKFRCRDFPKLFKKTQSIDWSKHLRGAFDVSVSAHRSRLMNKKRIAETVGEAIEKSMKAKKPTVKRAGDPLAANIQTIYVRFDNDEAEISLDTSGEALFKRGYKELDAVAPIRENLAAGLFWALYKKAGRPEKIAVTDLTCGSGTLLTEAALFFRQPTKPSDAIASPAVRLFGFDRSNEAVEIAQKNAANLKFEKLSRFEVADFLKADDVKSIRSQLTLSGSEVLLGLSNPPYGVRIKWPVPPKEFYRGLVEAYKAAGCRYFGFIVPRAALKSVPRPVDSFSFKNGGIDVVFNIYES